MPNSATTIANSTISGKSSMMVVETLLVLATELPAAPRAVPTAKDVRLRYPRIGLFDSSFHSSKPLLIY